MTTYRKIDSLTPLRFVAAALIVVHHSRGMLWLPPDIFRTVSFDHAVSFFFILSGFVLMHVYPTLEGGAAIRRFWVARFARIWPAHLTAFLLFSFLFVPWTIYVYEPRYTFLAILNLLMVQAWIPIKEFFFSFNAVAWSISTEFFFYLLFPFIVRDFGATWVRKLSVSILIVIGLIVLCSKLGLNDIWTAPVNEISIEGLVYINPLSRIFEFILGMCVYRLYHTIYPKIAFGRLAGSILEVLAVCATFIFLCYQYLLVGAISQMVGPAGAIYWGHSGSTLVFAILILVIALERGVISQVLRMKGAVFLGEISYSVYLFHVIVLRLFTEHLQDAGSIPGYVQYLVFWAMLIILSGISWLMIERPSRRLLVGWINGKSVLGRWGDSQKAWKKIIRYE
jgi:peptidoglycan/LPS O-acetylase OafA/YrhL